MRAALLVAAALAAGCAQKKTAAPAPPPDAPPPAADLFAGCRGAREHGTTALECGDGLTVTVVRSRSERAADPELLRQALEAARRALEGDGVAISERGARAIAGAAAAEAFRYHIGEDDERGRGLLAVASGGPSTVVTILCVDRRDAGACEPMAAEVLAKGVPARLVPDGGAEPPAEAVRFAGRELAIPSGCTSSGGQDLACGAANLAWSRVSDDTFANAGDTFFDGLMGAAGGMPRPDFTADVPCTIDGVAVTCRRRIWTRENTLGVAISGAAKVRGEPTAVVCFWTTDGKTPGTALPPVCTALLSVVER